MVAVADACLFLDILNKPFQDWVLENYEFIQGNEKTFTMHDTIFNDPYTQCQNFTSTCLEHTNNVSIAAE